MVNSLYSLKYTGSSYDDFLDKYICVADKLENYRQMQNIIRNDMAGILVEKIFLK